MTGKKVLLVEGDEDQWSRTGKIFIDAGYHFSAVADGLSAFKKIKDGHFDLVIAELNLPQMSGIDLLTRIKDVNASIPVILVSDDACVEKAVEAMKLGALDFIIKPLTRQTIDILAGQQSPDRQQVEKRGSGGSTGNKHSIITKNKEMARLLQIVEAIADSQASVFIQGESGTGKELFARHIHHRSHRNDKPFVAINCAALPETLLESELFGHEKGAFTGAVNMKMGKFEIANHGTLLLDEIGEMDYGLQSKLLRVIQEREIDRVGGTGTIPIDVRIIATTNRDIEKDVDAGKFREDLYYRLNVIPFHLPPLRDRRDDIPHLTSYFIKKYNDIDNRDVKGLTETATSLLLQMPWKGNVRELENITERAILMCDGDMIKEQDLTFNANCRPAREVDPRLSSPIHPVSLREMEKKAIFHTLDQTDGNRTHAAEILGISVRTLRNKLNDYRNTMKGQQKA
ncbi:MAG: sigma-54 dependent transcriptional regulator [Desulfobacterales bacterium]